MSSLRDGARKAAEKAAQDWHAAFDPDDTLDERIADAVAVAVCRYFFDRDERRRADGWSDYVRLPHLIGDIRSALAAFAVAPVAPETPVAECDGCGTLKAVCIPRSKPCCPDCHCRLIAVVQPEPVAPQTREAEPTYTAAEITDPGFYRLHNHLASSPEPTPPAEPETPEPETAQDALLHPAQQVYFRAGLIACREYMARFVEAESPSMAMSIRANWWPSLGQDFGPPRQLDFTEVTSGEYGSPDFRIKTAEEVSPTQEALPIALGFLTSAAPVSSDARTQDAARIVDKLINFPITATGRLRMIETLQAELDALLKGADV